MTQSELDEVTAAVIADLKAIEKQLAKQRAERDRALRSLATCHEVDRLFAVGHPLVITTRPRSAA